MENDSSPAVDETQQVEAEVKESEVEQKETVEQTESNENAEQSQDVEESNEEAQNEGK